MSGEARLKPTRTAGAVVIKKVPWLERRRLYTRAGALSRELMGRLAAWNLELRSPERILQTLNLAAEDMETLSALSRRPEGWQPFTADPEAPSAAGRLAALGLIRLARLRRLISLTDAGRLLLLLTAIDPQIKKARPEGGRKDD